MHTILDLTNWGQLLTENINESWDTWQQKFLEVMEHVQCIPIGTLSKRRNLPWLDKSIVQAIKRRNHLYKKHKRSNNPMLRVQYARLRNQVTVRLRHAKQSYLGKLKQAKKSCFLASCACVRSCYGSLLLMGIYPGSLLINGKISRKSPN